MLQLSIIAGLAARNVTPIDLLSYRLLYASHRELMVRAPGGRAARPRRGDRARREHGAIEQLP
ncbi:MAG: hypothetical protein ACRDI2_03895 [Chloroflexota bacterium]